MSEFKINPGTTGLARHSSLTLSEARGIGQKPTLEQAANGFEGIFLKTMMKEMSEAKLDDGALESEAEKPFQTMLHDRYADLAGGKSGFGIGESIRKMFAKNVTPEAQ
jgi:Rod binding domain-containing protein